MRHRKTALNSIRSQRGQAATEFALVLPVLAFLLFAIIQLGIVFNHYVTVTDATRAGARKAAVSSELPDPVGATEAAVRASATNLDQTQLAVSVSSSWQKGEDVSVTASYPYEVDLLGLVISSGTLSSTTTERVE